ncbi:AlpA family phage regulatory protein [Terriglobus albidus]|uniref:AlpA family phage regulatory protein n=1 Tax=Terriglobus albidus TaxID=1592106 RepID=A0A5B9E8M2_9BACT|nr:AlpA family phage regulatory protein [Terriglobus albidus]QEE28582.1 AlpA family phage regulatory protein [Terriglobus albidus]
MNVLERQSFLRLPAVQQRVPFSKSSIYAMVAAGLFPAPRRLGARAVGWLEADVNRWVEARIAAAPEVPAAPRPRRRK